MKKKKKKNLKRLLLSFFTRRWQCAHLRTPLICSDAIDYLVPLLRVPEPINNPCKVRLLASYLCLQMLSACAAIPATSTSKIRYSTPPNTGSWLQAQRELFACETIDAARYMANTGFFHGQCKQLEHIGLREYQVQSRTKIKLPEGQMWLLKVRHDNANFWVPIPWHDWA